MSCLCFAWHMKWLKIDLFWKQVLAMYVRQTQMVRNANFFEVIFHKKCLCLEWRVTVCTVESTLMLLVALALAHWRPYSALPQFCCDLELLHILCLNYHFGKSQWYTTHFCRHFIFIFNIWSEYFADTLSITCQNQTFLLQSELCVHGSCHKTKEKKCFSKHFI